mmetsp:Transcript_76302/g.139557  ORF Transcript_76302/g.139557 Transcript_76302/m.139557 type:complete len:102 (-) Transcript_76302:1316-1621(-)
MCVRTAKVSIEKDCYDNWTITSPRITSHEGQRNFTIETAGKIHRGAVNFAYLEEVKVFAGHAKSAVCFVTMRPGILLISAPVCHDGRIQETADWDHCVDQG